MKGFPRTIGRYQVKKKIGEGVFGTVYLAHDLLIDRPVAIKSILFENISAGRVARKTVRLFLKEARIIGKLNHPHITALWDMGTQDSYPYLVMEYVRGKTIKDLIDERTREPIDQTLRIIAMIARALHYVHQRGILHRDIKPANIMIMPDGSPKIMDFGVSHIFQTASGLDESSHKTVGSFCGTPYYMSPEQARGREVGPRSDIFSLGILAYEWLSGLRPFTGRTVEEVTSEVTGKEPRALTEMMECDEGLWQLISRALIKDPAKRYQTAEDFSDAVEIYLSNQQKKGEEDFQDTSMSFRNFSAHQLRAAEMLRRNYMIFSEFTDQDFADIFEISNKERFNPGEMIIEEKSSGVKMYLIVKGLVSIYKTVNGKSLEIKKLKDGDCFGEMAIIDKHPRSASVIALEKTLTIAINEAVLRHSNPELCLKLYRSLASAVSEKLRDADRKYMSLYSGMARVMDKAAGIND